MVDGWYCRPRCYRGEGPRMVANSSVDLTVPVLAHQQERSGLSAWVATTASFGRRKPLGAVGGLLVAAMFLSGLFAALIAPYGYDERAYSELLQGPSAQHLLGTDDVGRDIFSRIVYGARFSMIVSFGAVLLSATLASAIGIVTGYYGGKVDTATQRLVAMWISFPPVLLLIVFAAMFGTPTKAADILPGPLHLKLDPAEQRMAQIIFATGLIFAGGFSRVVRGAVIAVRYNTYMEAARALGVPT